MKLKRLILFGLLVATVVVKAQSDFKPGYVIKNSGDTLFGEIDSRGDLSMSNACKFKDTANNVTTYTPFELAAYRFLDSKYYVTKEINNQKIFLEYLIKGRINLFYMRDGGGDHYYIDKDTISIVEIPYKEEIKYNENEQVLYKSKTHIGLLVYFMQDAPGFQKRIEELERPDRNFLVKLVKDYHYAVCNDEKCVIYEKKQTVKVNLEVVAGMTNFKNITNVQPNTYFQYGAIAHFWLPRVNEKIYLKAGYLFSRVDLPSNKKSLFVITTLQIGYMMPKAYRIRPSLFVGLLSPSYSGAVHVRISKKANLGIQGMANFKSIGVPWVPSSTLANYSLLLGVYFEL